MFLQLTSNPLQPFYDSMLVKCTCRGPTYEIVRRKMLRALVEFRIRGVKTNIPFLLSLLSHPTSLTASAGPLSSTTLLSFSTSSAVRTVRRSFSPTLESFVSTAAWLWDRSASPSSRVTLSCQHSTTPTTKQLTHQSLVRRVGARFFWREVQKASPRLCVRTRAP